MRWLALFLLILNSLVWYHASRAPAPVEEGSARPSGGQLPRVADLRPTAPEQASKPEQVMSAVSPEVAAEEVDPPGGEVDPPEPIECRRLQWFAGRESAEAFRERYLPGARVRELQRDLPSLHWVIIPPRPPEQAQALFRELQAKGVDSYLVREGENRNAISLGLFENQDSAQRVLEERKSQNLNAVLAKFPRNQISYALDFELDRTSASGAMAMPDTWRDNPLNLIKIEGCKGVASTEKNP